MNEKLKITVKPIIDNIIIPVLILISLLSIISFFIYMYFENGQSATIAKIDDYTIWFNTTLILLTAILAFVAWSQIGKLNENLQNEIETLKDKNSKLQAKYLLQIDQKWHSTEIIEARKVIHQIYLSVMMSINKKEKPKELKRCLMGEIIINLSDDNKKIQDFIYLLNLLDFMESVAYFVMKEYLTVQDINELIGASIKFNYEIFKPYIEHRRFSHEDKTLYTQFERLYLKICEQDLK